MHSFVSRAGRWSLALTTVVAVACSDDPVAPKLSPVGKPNASLADPFTVTNLNDSGIGSLRWVLGYAVGGETIRFDSTLAGQTITLDSTLRVTKIVTIEGPAKKGITISGGGKGTVISVYQDGPTIFRNVSITGGLGGGWAGTAAAISGSADVVLENSAVFGNTGNGAIVTPQITLINSTVSGNTMVTTSGVLRATKTVVINSTVAFNSGRAIDGGTAVLRNAILSNNNSDRNCGGGPPNTIREGTNLSDDDSCGGPSEMIIANPQLQPLADNGGPTRTHALVAGSPAINAGASCSVPVDQRYVPRDAQCDLGAYEFTTPTTVTLTIDPSAAVNQGNGWAVVTGTIKCSRNETFNVAVQLEQQQKSGRDVATVDAAAIVPVECGTTVRPWIASMVLTSGAFQTGSGEAKAQTVNTPGWVTPANASAKVKMYWARRSG